MSPTGPAGRGHGALQSLWAGSGGAVFRNKHVITALLVAPLLAVLAWFAVGAFVGEDAHRALAGRAYPLLEKSTCRYASGRCDLDNGNLHLSLAAADRGSGFALLLEASHALDSAKLAVVNAGAASTTPRDLEALDERGRSWRITLAARPMPPQRLRLAATRAGTAFYAETSTAFLAPRERLR